MTAGSIKSTDIVKSAKAKALVALLLLIAQVFIAGAALAQTYEPQYNQGQQGSDGAQAGGQALNTDNTVPNPYIDAKGFIPIVNDSAQVNVHGGGNQYGSTRGIQLNVNDILKRDNPYGQAEESGVQPRVFVEKQYLENGNSQQDFQNQMQLLQQQNQQLSSNTLASLAAQSGEQGLSGMATSGASGLINSGLGSINETYRGMHQWFNDDLIGNLLSQIGQLIGKWISELVNGWISDAVQFLASFLRVFVLNPNIAVNGLNGSQSDGISPYIRQGADVMYGIAVDLLLLLFILAIWKYWAEASWRGGGNLMGAVGRLIFTAGLMLAFPTLYAFEIQITNEMIKAIYFNSSDQVMMLDAALASAIKGGLLAGVGGLTSAFAPLLGSVTLGFVGATVGQIFAFAGLIIFTILGGILIAELVYLLVLKAIQTALLTAQYMFAPIFLVFFATPDTESIASGFIRAWVETSLWTFVWVGLLKILVIIMFSDYNPWGKILMAVGVLQMMLQVPTFLARAQISPMSEFLSAGLIFFGIKSLFGALGNGANALFNRAMNRKMGDVLSKDQQGSKNPTTTDVNTPDASRNFSTFSKAGQGDPNAIAKLNAEKNKNGQGGPGTPGTTPPGVTPPGGPRPNGPTPPTKNGQQQQQNPNAQNLQTPTGQQQNGAVPPGTQQNKQGVNPGTNPAQNPMAQNPVTPGTQQNPQNPQNQQKNQTTNPALNPMAQNPVTPGAQNQQKNQTNVPPTNPALNPTPQNPMTPGAQNQQNQQNLNPAQTQTAQNPVTPQGQQNQQNQQNKQPNPMQPTAAQTQAAQQTGPIGAGRKLATAAALAAAGGGLAAGLGAAQTGLNAGGRGRGGNNPPDAQIAGLDDDTPKWEEARLSTRYYSNDGMYGVDAVRGIVASIKTLGTRVREGQKANSIEGTTKGGASFINLREGATDAEKARTLMVAGLANRMLDDPQGFDAAKAAAVNENAGGPQGMMEQMMANYMDAQGQDWRTSPIGKYRLQRAVYGKAVKGAQAYLNGGSGPGDGVGGNEYTEHLVSRYGRWTPDKDAMAVWIATDSEASESAWNPAIGPATDALQASGLAITPATRGAIQNPYVMTMRPGARKAAVRSLLRYCMRDERMQGVDAGTTEGAILLGEIARSVPNAQSVIDIDAASTGRDLSSDVVNSTSMLANEVGLNIGQTYAASVSGVGAVAANITGVPQMKQARSFDQVRRMCYATYSDPGQAQQAFDTILVASQDRVRMMNTAGVQTRMMVDPGFTSQLDDFVESAAGGYVNIDDPGNAARRDNLQTAVQAAGITVRHLGTAGFNSSRANAVYRWIQDGNNPNQLSGQDIIVTERLISSGAPRVSQSLVQVTRALDNGSGRIDSDTLHMYQDVAGHVDMGNARADQAVAVKNILSAGGQVNRQTVEVATRLQYQPGGFQPSVYRVEANLLAQDVVRSGGDAHTVLTRAVQCAARDRGVDTNLPLDQIMSRLEQQGAGPQYIESKIMDIVQRGGFDSRQLTSPQTVEVMVTQADGSQAPQQMTTFEIAYQAASDFSQNSHRVTSIAVAERIHGTQALADETILQTYDTVLESGVEPQHMNLQRFYAAHALQQAKAAFPVPQGGSQPMPNVRVLDMIRQDSRFRMDGAARGSYPKMDQQMWNDVCQRWQQMQRQP